MTFDSETLKNQVLHDPVEPIPGLSESVNAALLKALSKKREDRFENCKAFVRALAVKSDTDSNDGLGVVLPVDRLADDVSQPTWLPSASLSSTATAMSKRAKRKRIVPTLIVAVILLLGLLGVGRGFLRETIPDAIKTEKTLNTTALTMPPSLSLPDYSGSGFTAEMLDKLKHLEEFPVIRMTLFMNEDYNGVLRVERCMSDTPPDNYFKGEPFTHSAFPNALVFRGKDGMGRMIWGFNDSLESSWNRYSGAWGRVTNTEKIADGTFHTFGGEIGIFTSRPPLRICCDFPDAQDGEATIFIGGGGGNQGGYARTWFYARHSSSDSYTIGYNASNVDLEYDDSLGTLPAQGINLEKPFERKIRFNTKFRGPDLGAAVYNSNGVKRITRFDLSVRMICQTGMKLTTKDNRLAIDNVREKFPAWRVGLQDGDIIERINGKEYTETEAKTLLKGAPFGTEYVLDIDRNGERQMYTVHAE